MHFLIINDDTIHACTSNHHPQSNRQSRRGKQDRSWECVKGEERDANEPGGPCCSMAKVTRVVRALPPVHQGCRNVVHLKVMALCPCACVPGMSTPPPRAHHVLVACAVFAGGRACLPYPHSRVSPWKRTM